MGFFDLFSSQPAQSAQPPPPPPPAACPMSNAKSAGTTNPLNPQGLKACCACPETKRARDDCFLKYDASVAPEACKDLLLQHIACMRGYGFDV